jgi:hypothetical protein
MLLNGSTVTGNDSNSRQGLDKTATELKQRATYETGLVWDFANVWEMGPSSYPFPILKWQNGVVKLPPGFSVIGEGETITASSTAEFASALSSIRGSTDSGFTITVTADMSLDPQDLTLAAYADKSITLRGNTPARTVSLSSQGSLFTVGADVELVLEDVVLRGMEDNNRALVRVNTDGKLVLNSGGKITGNTHKTSSSSLFGGGVYVASGGIFTMNGGEILGNTITASDNLRGYGGGVYVIRTFTMYGGTISGNTASGGSYGAGGGGGVYVNTGTFTMHDGAISGNTVKDGYSDGYYGGGVYVNTGTYTMNGGEIKGNTGSDGGGVYVYGTGSSLTMSGGVIYGSNAAQGLRNTASVSGAALKILMGNGYYGTFSGNTFSQTGTLSTTEDTIRIVNGVLQNN